MQRPDTSMLSAYCLKIKNNRNYRDTYTQYLVTYYQFLIVVCNQIQSEPTVHKSRLFGQIFTQNVRNTVR